MMLAIPAGAVATSLPGIAQHASVAAVVLWLTGLGWGFHAMLHHRLAAEDRLAQLETRVALERDAHQALVHTTRERALVLAAEWTRLQACLCADDRRNIPERMHALQAAIVLLQDAA
jgi:hypothetical protein